VVMLDIDDFKKVNDVFGHGTGDQILVALADVLRSSIRTSDIVCRIGGEEFAVIMPVCTATDARGFAERVTKHLAATEFEGAGRITVSVGVSQGPEDAMNPRELVAYAETAMMTAKTRGKNAVVLFDELTDGRPVTHEPGRQDVRSIAHLKMLQSLAGKLNRLNDVTRIGEVIVSELRGLIDYHNCRVYVHEGDDLIPIAFRGDLGEYSYENVEELKCRMGEGITGRVAETGESLLLANALECEYAVTIPGTVDLDESMIAVPLRYGSRINGVIVLSKLGIGQFDLDDVRLLEVLGGHASVAIENARLYEAQRCEADSAKQSAEIANALLDLGRELAAAEDLDAVLDRLVGLSTKILGSSLTSVWLQEHGTGDFVVRAMWGYGDSDRERLAALSLSPEVAKRFLQLDEPFVLTPDQVSHLPGVGEATDSDENRMFAIAPIQVDLMRKGFLVSVLTDAAKPRFTERKMQLLAGVAHQAKLAITNAMSFESLEQTFLSTVEALANALEANDEYTSSHARAITDMALGVGTHLGLDPKSLKRLELGALFHDIGKIGIPSEVLLKPGSLTSDEREVIEQHPELGERILAPIVRLSDVRPIVRHCHERFDGAGYPDQLAAEDIPLESRIILVCDAFHAMTTDRPYRGRLSLEEACRRLRDGAGTQFDPDVVGVFLDVLNSTPERAPLSL
jgi:diguanylate cyclase (GGDEF)-like protein